MNIKSIAWAAAALIAGAVAPAHAQLTSTGLSCDSGSVLEPFSTTPLACSGAWAGNDANQQADLQAQLSTDFAGVLGSGATYTFVGKSDDSGSGPFTSNPETTSGTLNFDTAQTGLFAVSLKAGNAFSVYLFDGGATGLASLSFSTLGVQVNQNGMPADLSHATLIDIGPEGIAPIPEPESYALMLAGLGALGLWARRRRPG